MPMHRTAYWCSYECSAVEDCRSRCVLFDLRIDLDEGEAAPEYAACPRCGVRAALKGSWLADSGGYGSRGDYDALIRQANQLGEEVLAFRAALNERDPTAVAAVYTKLLEERNKEVSDG